MEDLRNEFPLLSNCTYLNTASSGLLSRSIIDWRREHDDTFFKNGSRFRDNQQKQLHKVRATLARVFHAQPEEVALVPNFSLGFNMCLESLPNKQKILVLEEDYPSVVWPIEDRNFEVIYVKVDAQLEENIWAAVTQHQPDVFAFSIVQFTSGIKINLDFLQQLKAYHPQLLLLADGTQYMGTEIFDFKDSAIDILGASAYKWLLAGYGNAFYLIKEEVQQRLQAATIGFNSVEANVAKRDYINFNKHLEPGHLDTLNFGSLKHALEALEKRGIPETSEKIKYISHLAKERFSELGWLEERVVAREIHSSIFNIKGNDEMFQKLQKNNIICSQRGNGIRISFHFYNSEDDLEHVIKVLS